MNGTIWLYFERHFCLSRGTAPFFNITGIARRNEIFPGIITISAAWHYMIEGQI